MRINWGTGILISFALFMGFILFFVFRVQSDSKYDNELVVEDYYKQERVLQSRLDKEQNAANLKQQLTISTSGDTIKIHFPDEFDPKKISGKVSLYRPSSQKLDFELPISTSTAYLLLPANDLPAGRWNIIIDWQYEGQEYRNTEMLIL